MTVDDYVIETLMADLVGHDKMPSAFIVYLHLYSRGKRGVRASHQDIANETGLSKSAVQAAIRNLVRRKLVRTERESITAVPRHFVLRPWRRPRSSD